MSIIVPSESSAHAMLESACHVLNTAEAPNPDFTYTITPCADGGAPFTLEVHAIDEESIHIWWLKYGGDRTWFGSGPTSSVVIYGGLNEDITVTVRDEMTYEYRTLYVKEKDIVIPHIDLPTTLIANLPTYGDVTLTYGPHEGGADRWQGDFTYMDLGVKHVWIYQYEGTTPTQLGTKLQLMIASGETPDEWHTVKTGCRGNPIGTWDTTGSYWGDEIVVTAGS